MQKQGDCSLRRVLTLGYFDWLSALPIKRDVMSTI
jgi:hypothetical protein